MDERGLKTDPRNELLRRPDNWPLLYHTATNMQISQLVGVAERAARHLLIPRLPVDFDARYERAIPDGIRSDPTAVSRNLETLRAALSDERIGQLREAVDDACDGVLSYMNRSLDIATADGIEWEDERLDEIPTFWRLKLQGFDFLRLAYLGYPSPSACPDTLTERLNRWIQDWDEETSVGTERYLRRSWIPHSVSLRLINLSRYLAWQADSLDTANRACFDRVLYKNALFLDNHVEYDIGGNHLIENAGGLVLAGAMFRRYDVGWLEEGRSILEAATDQFLPDGGHFERSPMYHIQSLTRYLTAFDIATTIGLPRSSRIERTARAATAYLRSIRPPDDQIPLFNDAVFDEALSLQACLSYADGVGVPSPAPGSRPSSLDASGYYWLRTGSNGMLIDGGEVGPPHLPAHSHNDMLSYVLWVDGERIITDTGTLEYAPTPERHRARSVRAHNTVQVGQEEPIDIGGQYAMGRRTTPNARSYTRGDLSVFEGRYRKSPLFGGGYTCRRRVVHRDSWWLVADRITGEQARRLHSRLHFHPAVELTQRDGALVAAKSEADATLWVYPSDELSPCVTESPYFPRFGDRRRRPAAAFETAGDDVVMGYLLSRKPVSSVEIDETPAGQLTARIGERTLSLPASTQEPRA